MNEKNLALRLMALAANMLVGNDCVAPTAIKVKTPIRPMHAPNCTCRACRPVAPTQRFNREPDGVQINVDRPRRENYLSHQKWAQDMANYRVLIDQAKKCEWPSRIPSNIPPHVHANRRDWYEDNERVAPIRVARVCEIPSLDEEWEWGW